MGRQAMRCACTSARKHVHAALINQHKGRKRKGNASHRWSRALREGVLTIRISCTWLCQGIAAEQYHHNSAPTLKDGVSEQHRGNELVSYRSTEGDTSVSHGGRPSSKLEGGSARQEQQHGRLGGCGCVYTSTHVAICVNQVL